MLWNTRGLFFFILKFIFKAAIQYYNFQKKIVPSNVTKFLAAIIEQFYEIEIVCFSTESGKPEKMDVPSSVVVSSVTVKSSSREHDRDRNVRNVIQLKRPNATKGNFFFFFSLISILDIKFK